MVKMITLSVLSLTLSSSFATEHYGVKCQGDCLFPPSSRESTLDRYHSSRGADPCNRKLAEQDGYVGALDQCKKLEGIAIANGCLVVECLDPSKAYQFDFKKLDDAEIKFSRGENLGTVLNYTHEIISLGKGNIKIDKLSGRNFSEESRRKFNYQPSETLKKVKLSPAELKKAQWKSIPEKAPEPSTLEKGLNGILKFFTDTMHQWLGGHDKNKQLNSVSDGQVKGVSNSQNTNRHSGASGKNSTDVH
jgi:hypothetical protein